MSVGVVFLDRDGVINRDSPDYIKSVEEWCAIPGSLEAIARLCRAGYRVVVVTNQSGLARGLFSEQDLAAIHSHMRSRVADCGGEIDGIFYCPHGPLDGCGCRKPEPGLILRAVAELGLSLDGAFCVGDRASDAEAGRRAGCSPVLIDPSADVAADPGTQADRSPPAAAREPGAAREAVEAKGVDVPVYPDLATFVDALLAP